MTETQYTVVYIPGFSEQHNFELRSQHLEQIVHKNNINFIFQLELMKMIMKVSFQNISFIFVSIMT